MPSFWEKIQVEGQDMDIYSGVPSGSGPFPAVVVIHPAAGVADFAQSIVQRLADAGYVAVAPDLFHRVTGEMLAGGRQRNEFLSDPEIVADVNATVDFLLNHPAIDGQRLGITGFCMGGRIVWLAAATNPHFKAMVPYYGGNIQAPRGAGTRSPFELTAGINCPMLFHFGGMDENPSPEDMRTFDAELTRLGKEHTFYSYPGAGHAFMDFTNPDRYHREAAEAAWPRTLEFFARHLKAAKVSR